MKIAILSDIHDNVWNLKKALSMNALQESDAYVMVIAHRADWRSFPENSIESTRSAIELGVDMVEIDIRKTKDGHLILMHDEKVDRTTNGSGKVSELTFTEIDSLRLMSGVGVPTSYKIPTLRQALLECKGKIMVNLDKADDYFEAIYPILKETNTIGQVVLKEHYTTEEFKTKFGDFYKEIIYMPLITAKIKDVKSYVESLEASLDPSCYEIVFHDAYMDSYNYIPELKKNNDNIWINTLWDSLAIDKTDDKAYWNPDENWGW
ncbi:MAG: glycerophosphodiester phosphodiesterase family protein [Flavobacteriaceae bacterium]